MNKIIFNFIATLILAFVLSLFLPWWSIMTAALATSLFITLKRASVFFVPFLAIFLFWFIYSYSLSVENNFIMAKGIATLLSLKGNPYLLIVLSATIGGIAAGVAALFGKQLTLIVNPK